MAKIDSQLPATDRGEGEATRFNLTLKSSIKGKEKIF
jgi:hypothetical protein